MMRSIVVCVLAAFLAFPAMAQTTAVENEGEISRVANQVSNEVMSPFCPGKTLAMCPSPAASEVRRDIQDMAREGMETEEIKTALIEEYGDEFQIVQPDTFDNTIILGLILAGLALCVGVVLFISRRRTTEGGTSDDDDDSPGPKQPSTGSRGAKGDSGEDGDVDDPYLSALRDEYRS